MRTDRFSGRLSAMPCTPPATHALPLWTEWLTHASENITMPRTSFLGGKNAIWQTIITKTRTNLLLSGET